MGKDFRRFFHAESGGINHEILVSGRPVIFGTIAPVVKFSGAVYLPNHLPGCLFLHFEDFRTILQPSFHGGIDIDTKSVFKIREDAVGTTTYNNTGFLFRQITDDVLLNTENFILHTANSHSQRILSLDFEKGIPVSDREGHGIGVQSICAIVERYGGVFNFLVENGNFILQLSI